MTKRNSRLYRALIEGHISVEQYLDTVMGAAAEEFPASDSRDAEVPARGAADAPIHSGVNAAGQVSANS